MSDLETLLKNAQDNLEDAQEYYSTLVNSIGISKSICDEYRDARITAYFSEEATISEQASATTKITSLLKEYPNLNQLNSVISDIGTYQNSVNFYELEIQKEQLTSESTTTQETIEEIDPSKQQGHIYPITLVTTWTNKLKQYNNSLDDFLDKIDKMDSKKVDVSWLCKKIEAFCRRINYCMALLRQQIVKTLSKLYSQANVFNSLLSSIVNTNPSDLGGALSWISNVIGFFNKPLQIIITFIKDFAQYTPPLITQAGKLAGKAALVPVKLVTKIDLVTENATEEQKATAEVYKQYTDITMPSLTYDVLTGGTQDEVVKYEEDPTKAKQKQNLKTQLDIKTQEVYNTWDDFITELSANFENNSQADVTMSDYPDKVSTITEGQYYTKEINSSISYTAEEVALEIFGQNALDSGEAYGVKFNTSQYVFYLRCSLSMFIYWVNSNESFKAGFRDYIINYYTLIAANSTDTTLINEYKKYKDFLEFYKIATDDIPTVLEKLQELCKDGYTLQEKYDNLSRRSIFD